MPLNVNTMEGWLLHEDVKVREIYSSCLEKQHHSRWRAFVERTTTEPLPPPLCDI